MKKLKAGIIGTGMGRLHMEGYSKDPRVEIFAICDINRKEAEEFAKKYKASYVFTDYEKMLDIEEIDLVSIATPNYLHAPMSIAALKRGKHVICEKPMATNLKDAQAMVEATKKAKKRLMVHMSMRFLPQFYLMKRLINKGILGKIYYGKSSWIRRRGTPIIDFPSTGIMGRGDWFVQKEKSGGGALMDIGVHVYDLGWWLMSSPEVASVLGSMFAEVTPPRFKERGIYANVDELSTVLVKFKNGASLFSEVSWDAHMEPGISIQIFGDKAGIRWQDSYLTLFREEEGTSTTTSIQLPSEDSLETSCHHFVSVILEADKKMIASGEECLEVIKVLDAIKESNAAKQSINFF
jgi:predicted dehydrogenase